MQHNTQRPHIIFAKEKFNFPYRLDPRGWLEVRLVSGLWHTHLRWLSGCDQSYGIGCAELRRLGRGLCEIGWLLCWYHHNGRGLPWIRTSAQQNWTSYGVLVQLAGLSRIWRKNCRLLKFLFKISIKRLLFLTKARLWSAQAALQFVAQLRRHWRFIWVGCQDYGLLFEKSRSHTTTWWTRSLEWSRYGVLCLYSAWQLFSNIYFLITYSWFSAIMAWVTIRANCRWLCGPFWLRHWSCPMIWLQYVPKLRRSCKIGKHKHFCVIFALMKISFYL